MEPELGRNEIAEDAAKLDRSKLDPGWDKKDLRDFGPRVLEINDPVLSDSHPAIAVSVPILKFGTLIGFRQTSLTNFERAELASDPRRYRYEQISYESSNCQVLGFGPSGISYSQSDDGTYALKTMNPESSAQYLQAVRSPGPAWNRHFQYERSDLELLHFTRRLAALRIDKATFSQLHGRSIWNRYSDRFELLVAEGLLKASQQEYSLTPRGMFFSDSIAALLAESRWQNPKEMPLVAASNNNSRGYM